MQTLFNGQTPVSPPPETAHLSAPSPLHLKLSVELAPWYRVFFGNLADRILFFRREPPLTLTSRPAPFWPDVFVERRVGLAAMRQSAIYHVFVIVAIWGLSQTWLMRPRSVALQNPLRHSTITYYSVSEYLPALNTSESEPAKVSKKGEPEYARQRIVSIPRRPESHVQTVIAPPHLKLPQDAPLPNLVAWTNRPSVPEAAITHSPSQLIAPPLPNVVAPAPEVRRDSLPLANTAEAVRPVPNVEGATNRSAADLSGKPSVVEPAPSLANLDSRKLHLPQPSAVEPKASTRNLPERLGDLNIAPTKVEIARPNLPMADQRARASLLDPSGGQGGGTHAGSLAVPPAPSMGEIVGQEHSGREAGQIIALGIHPAAVTGPIHVPEGNRSGIFAAGPEGKQGASGTPDIKGDGLHEGSGGSGEPNSTGAAENAGLSVSPGAVRPKGNVVVAGSAPHSARNPLLAALTRPSIAELTRGADLRNSRLGGKGLPSAPEVQDNVFHGKRFYSMILNMPNLTSASGSWIIRFAELHETPGDLSAPVATQKVDPAYPTALMRQHIEGTVVLYAVIHANGTVGEVRVLRGVDSRLDENARLALLKWHFRPGRKNGVAVDVEAVVQIPFVALNFDSGP